MRTLVRAGAGAGLVGFSISFCALFVAACADDPSSSPGPGPFGSDAGTAEDARSGPDPFEDAGTDSGPSSGDAGRDAARPAEGDWSPAAGFTGDVQSLAISDLGSGTLPIVALGSSGAQRSIDNGITWSAFNEGLTNPRGVSLGAIPGGTSLLASSERGAADAGAPYVFASTNGGAWSSRDITVPAAGAVPNDAHDVHGWLVLGGAGQMGCGRNVATGGPDVLQGKMGGSKWKVNPILPPATSQGACRALVGQANDNLYATVFAPGSVGGVFQSTGGQAVDWSDVGAGIDPADKPYTFALAMSRTQPKTLYVGIQRSGGGRVYKTVDGAVTWSRASEGIPEGDPVVSLAVHPTLPNVAYAGTRSGVYKTADGGASWTLSHASRGATVTALAVHHLDGTMVFAGMDAAPGLWISRSGG
ncbi:WD40/YVTN/BNR-like repeat-containing protein [Pendulispora albinea]|uniref:Uncharacterized protein n=1 Tax=Pendulispora albinea TaxID=2741071 RepID=A0ABZ2M005_9BACT